MISVANDRIFLKLDHIESLLSLSCKEHLRQPSCHLLSIFMHSIYPPRSRNIWSDMPLFRHPLSASTLQPASLSVFVDEPATRPHRLLGQQPVPPACLRRTLPPHTTLRAPIRRWRLPIPIVVCNSTTIHVKKKSTPAYPRPRRSKFLQLQINAYSVFHCPSDDSHRQQLSLPASRQANLNTINQSIPQHPRSMAWSSSMPHTSELANAYRNTCQYPFTHTYIICFLNNTKYCI